MQVSDLDAVVAAEAALHPSPWSTGNFRDSLLAGHRAVIAEENEQLVGYAVTSQVLDEAELLTIGVPAHAQRRGHGAALLTALLDGLRADGVRRVFLEVRESNLPAHNLYRRHGFVAIGRRKGYYPTPHGREDAVTMALQLAAQE
ncbi:MAG: ribosomal protein S18-alanine N-acetyltransferase [Rhodocyclaceae bacterium]|nr:ribosomal protein S18-alanine N-acetyltransferase [Rhodocyclaceae bacterium]MBK6907100.1 ribosomal protein S18-alanine N-acetyltransferase [Rhodocyclaceae bacterium]